MRSFFKLALVLGCCISTTAYAGDISFKGFGSVVAGIADLDEGREGLDDGLIYGYDDEFSFKNDSLFALQMDAEVNERVTATIQLMSKGNNNFDVEMEWAYMNIQLNDTWDLSVGRIRIPFYRYSDFLDVRYAFPWITTPDTAYGLDAPGYDGISLVNTTSLGSFDSVWQIIFGNVKDGLINNSFDTHLTNLLGTSWSLSRDWFFMRLGYLTGEAELTNSLLNNSDPSNPGLVDVIRAAAISAQQFTTEINAAADSVAIFEDQGSFLSFSIGMDFDSFFAEAEYIDYQIDDAIFADTTSWYVLTGFRTGDFTFYTTYSQENADPQRDSVDTLTALNLPSLAPLIAGVSAASESLAIDTSMWNIGMRWDVLPSTALKVSYENNSSAKIIPGTNEEYGDATVFRVGIDVVF